MEDIEKIIQEETVSLLEKLGIEATVNVEAANEGYNVLIDTSENALLIGKHGNTLTSLELILSLIVAKKAGEFKRLILEVGEYRKEREQYLRDLVMRFKDEVLGSSYEKTIRGLKPWERRFIHILLQDDPDVTTESVGEGRDRVLMIKKK